jgi:hypothetical protein
MKRAILLILALLFMGGGTVFAAEEIEAVYHEYDLALASSGTTTGINQAATRSGISWFTVDGATGPLDMYAVKNNVGSYTFQIYQVSLADSNVNGVTLSTANASGATLTAYYQRGVVNSENLWIGSGVTAIIGPVALSGQTCESIEFYPEAGRYLYIGVLTGMTPFEAIRAKLLVQ